MSWSLLENSFASDPFAKLFRGFFHDAPGVLGRAHQSGAPLAAWRDDDGLLIRVELPGFAPESIDVSVEGDLLEVKAENQREPLAEGDRLHRRERNHGSLSRSLRLPFRIDSDKVEADYQHGILELRLPRAAEDKPRTIPVK